MCVLYTRAWTVVHCLSLELLERVSSCFELDGHCRFTIGRNVLSQTGCLLRCVRYSGRYTTGVRESESLFYCRAAVGSCCEKSCQNMMLGVTVALSLSWLSWCASSRM
jgi:hypothetical protein